MQPKPCARCAQMPYISPGFICHTEGCRWAITAEMIRQPKESDMAEKMDSERKAFEAFCASRGWDISDDPANDSAWLAWQARAALAEQAVDVVAIRGVIADIEASSLADEWLAPDRWADKLTRAIGNAQAVDVGTIREVIDDLREWGETDAQLAARAVTLTRAIGDARADD